MAYIALYRKWRPKTFTDVVGQKQVSETLMRAVREGKVAHAYLFSGPRGTGKTSMAKILARAINCEQGPTDHPCNACRACLQVLEGDSMDVIEIDAASNRGIDEIRALRENVKFLPVSGRKKIFIIDEAHMLTNESWNALLKTVEEPPEHVMFIFATTEAEKIPVTILSRCQRYAFRRITIEDMAAHLLHVAQESHITLTAGAAHLIAVQADGGLRDALSMLDQCSSMTDETITEEVVVELLGLIGKEQVLDLFDALLRGDGPFILKDIKRTLYEGREVSQIVDTLGEHMRALLLYKAMPTAEELSVYEDYKERLQGQAEALSIEELEAYMGRLQRMQSEIRLVDNQRLIVEMGLMAICAKELAKKEIRDLSDLQERIQRMERRYEQDADRLQERINDVKRYVDEEIANRPVTTVAPSAPPIPVPIPVATTEEPPTIPFKVFPMEESIVAKQAKSKEKKKPGISSAKKREPVQAYQAGDIVHYNEYMRIHKDLLKRLEDNEQGFIKSSLELGTLFYVDMGHVVYAFKQNMLINILEQTPKAIENLNKILSKYMRRDMQVQFLHVDSEAFQAYKGLIKERFEGSANSAFIKQTEGVNTQKKIVDPQEIPVEGFGDVSSTSRETVSGGPVEDFSRGPVEDFSVEPVEDFSRGPVEDFSVEPVEDFSVEPVEDFSVETFDNYLNQFETEEEYDVSAYRGELPSNVRKLEGAELASHLQKRNLKQIVDEKGQECDLYVLEEEG